VRKSDLRSLFGHSAADFRNAVPDADDSRLARRVKEAPTIVGGDPGAFASDRDRQILAEISRKQSG
jgi:hypothetical protein